MSNLSLEIAATGLNAQQTAMDTVAQNLANANTAGYVAESTVLTTNPSNDMQGVGDGVRVVGVSQVPDQLAQVANQQAQGALAQGTALQQVLTQVQDAFPEPNGGGISTQLANFWSSWDNINQNPSSQAPYTAVVDNAQGLVTSLNQASAAVSQASSDAVSQLSNLVSSDNSLIQQVAQLNGEIVSVSGSGASANSLVDQQNQVVDQLANDLGATATTQPNGTVNLTIGGSTLVEGTTATELQVGTGTLPGSSPPTTGTVVVNQANGQPITLTSGTAAGLSAAINTYLPNYQNQLNTVAQGLATTTDSGLSAGFTTAGTAGDPLFVVQGTSGSSATTTGITAATIAVNPSVSTNPQATLAVSSVSGSSATNNGANAQAIAESGGLNTSAPNQAYTDFIQNLGSDVQATNNQVTAQTSVANAASQNLSEIAGVNTNQQMVALLNYQHTYQASAQVISTVNTAIQSLLMAV